MRQVVGVQVLLWKIGISLHSQTDKQKSPPLLPWSVGIDLNEGENADQTAREEAAGAKIGELWHAQPFTATKITKKVILTKSDPIVYRTVSKNLS